MNQSMMPYEQLPRVKDAEFKQRGIFAELTYDLTQKQSFIAGARLDDWTFTDRRDRVSLSMMATAANPSAGQSRDESLSSGFLRYERVLDWKGANFFAGIGHSERFPDYWELVAKETENSVSAFDIESEKTTQIDVGLIYSDGRLSGSASVFYNEIDDFLMIESGYKKPGMMGMSRTTSIVRNIDARSWGMEIDGQYAISENWRTSLTVASVRGANDTDQRTLAQLPPLETRIGLHYDDQKWSAGLLYRNIAEQNRVDIGRGNIAGQDFGPTASANILSFNGGWRASDKLLVTAGVDNLFDETYAEHISRAGAAIPGFDQIARMNEPGRTLWFKAQFSI